MQPGSLDSEAGIFKMCFDHSGSRLITCEADETIKVMRNFGDVKHAGNGQGAAWQPAQAADASGKQDFPQGSTRGNRNGTAFFEYAAEDGANGNLKNYVVDDKAA